MADVIEVVVMFLSDCLNHLAPDATCPFSESTSEVEAVVMFLSTADTTTCLSPDATCPFSESTSEVEVVVMF